MTANMAAPAAPDIGLPYKAIDNYDPAQHNRPETMALSVGDRGRVVTESSGGWTRVSVSRTGASGWVPTDRIQVNRNPFRMVHDSNDGTDPVSIPAVGGSLHISLEASGLNREHNQTSSTTSTSSNSPTLFTRVDRPDVMILYGPATKAIRLDDKVIFELLRTTSSSTKQDVFVATIGSDEPGSQPDTLVWPIFEIMLNGQAHRAPWARLSDWGIWPDWDQVKSLGLRLQWDVNGKTLYRYVQHDSMADFADGSAGSIIAYIKVTALFRLFFHATQQHPRSYDLDYGIARIKTLKMNQDENVLHIKDLVSSPRVLPRFTRKTDEQMVREMTALGFTNVNGDHDHHTQRGVMGITRTRGPGSKICDSCWILDVYPNVGPPRTKCNS